jgi:hypothetical protein
MVKTTILDRQGFPRSCQKGQEYPGPHMASLDPSHVYPGHSFGDALDGLLPENWTIHNERILLR